MVIGKRDFGMKELVSSFKFGVSSGKTEWQHICPMSRRLPTVLAILPDGGLQCENHLYAKSIPCGYLCARRKRSFSGQRHGSPAPIHNDKTGYNHQATDHHLQAQDSIFERDSAAPEADHTKREAKLCHRHEHRPEHEERRTRY